MDRKYQVFISSTYEDLKDERLKVSDAIIRLGHFPVGMELFNAANDSQWNVIKKHIKESDYYILIVSDRYGSCDESGKSYTEKEWDFAVSNGIPTLAFVRSKEAIEALPHEKRERNSGRELEAFKAKVSKKLWKEWGDANDLANAFYPSFIELTQVEPRDGWVRFDQRLSQANEKREDLSERLNEVLEENKILRIELDSKNNTKINADVYRNNLLDSIKSMIACKIKGSSGAMYDAADFWRNVLPIFSYSRPVQEVVSIISDGSKIDLSDGVSAEFVIGLVAAYGFIKIETSVQTGYGFSMPCIRPDSKLIRDALIELTAPP